MDSEFSVELGRRRAALQKELGSDLLVLFSAPVHLRNGDVEQSYRQDSDFFYLTGIEEPDCALVLGAETGFILFVRPRNRERETWEGRRMGVEGAVEFYGAKVAHPIEELDERLADYLEDKQAVHYLMGQEVVWDRIMIDALNRVRARRRKRVQAPKALLDGRLLLHEARLIKSPFEQTKMAEVAQLSAEAHNAAMAFVSPQTPEWQLQNCIEFEFRKSGAQRLAYDSIVGSGENATILHYRENNRMMSEGELVLVDAGAEKDYYAADITRTYPVAGRFLPEQGRLYQAVLDSQQAAIAATVVGATLEAVHDAAWQVLRDALQREGLLGDEDTKDEESIKKRVNRFFMHRTSHYLGMDVHDVGGYFVEKEPRPLLAGMVITVEPGLYFAPDDETVPEVYRGIGIRIEDDVLVSEAGPVVLTGAAVKEIAEIEAMCLQM